MARNGKQPPTEPESQREIVQAIPDQALSARPDSAASLTRTTVTEMVLSELIDEGLERIRDGAIEIRASDVIKAVELLNKLGLAKGDEFWEALRDKMKNPIDLNSPLGQRPINPLGIERINVGGPETEDYEEGNGDGQGS